MMMMTTTTTTMPLKVNFIEIRWPWVNEYITCGIFLNDVWKRFFFKFEVWVVISNEMLAYFSVSLVAEILIQSSGNSGCFRSRDVIPDPNKPATIHSFTCSHNTGQAYRDIFRGSKASLFDTDSSMVYCVVVGCSNRTNDRKDKPKFEGSFHQLPEDPHVRRLWIKRINRQDHEWLKFLAGDKTADGSTAKRHVC